MMAEMNISGAKSHSVPGKVVVWMDALSRVANKIADKSIQATVVTALEQFERAAMQHNIACDNVLTTQEQLRRNVAQLLISVQRTEAILRQCQTDEDSLKTALAIFAKINMEVRKAAKRLNAASLNYPPSLS